jgi:hypothetical protein
MSARTVDACGLCGGDNLRTILSLGESPPTCAMTRVGETPTEESYPLELLRCQECGLVQLSVVVDPGTVFPPDYPYSSGNSKALRDDFADLAAHAKQWAGGLGKDDLVVDIGANDGTLLSNFTCRTVGVEPTRQAAGIQGPAYEEFFTEELARQIRDEHGPAKVVTACNVLAHVMDVHDVMRGISHLLADDGVLIAENHDFASVANGQWDTVYHEHLRFYDYLSFHRLVTMHGFDLDRVANIPTHGGSFRAFSLKVEPDPTASIRPRYNLDKLARDAVASRLAIQAATEDGIWGIGATARATTIINYCGLDVEDVECVCEVEGSDKIDRYIPGTRIPVINEDALFEQQPAKVILFSWHLADSIVPKLRERGYEGEIIVPLPEVRSL